MYRSNMGSVKISHCHETSDQSSSIRMERDQIAQDQEDVYPAASTGARHI